MPRPKRSKVAPSAPIKLPHSRVTQPAVTASTSQKPKDRLSPASSQRVANGSDDSDGLVVTKATGSTRKDGTSQEYTMSGALTLEDVGSTRLRPPSSKTRAELTRITRDADYAQTVKEGAAPTKRSRIRETEEREPEQISSSIPTERNDLRQHASSSSSRQSSAQKSAEGRLGTRPQATPRFQTSMLGGAAFKKRPRQPSLLQMVQSQKETEDELDENDMYNFLPDDESTPLIKSLSEPHAHVRSSSSHQTSGSRKRKQTTPEIQVPASQSQSALPRSSPSLAPPQSPEQEDIFGIPSDQEQSPPTLPRHRSTQTPQPQIFSDTLAPPQSSSPAKQPSPAPPRTKSKPKKPQQQPKRKAPPSAPSPLSPQSTLTSPVRNPQPKPLATATLQNLLPRRRARVVKPKSDYDMPSSSSNVELDNTGLGEDEDELSFHATKVRRKKNKPGATVSKSAAAAAAKGKESGTKKTTKTYARKSIVLSHDSDDDDDSEADGEEALNRKRDVGGGKTPAMMGEKAKAEMRRLVDKFREVDEFALDFEDVTGSSSQMQDAR